MVITKYSFYWNLSSSIQYHKKRQNRWLWWDILIAYRNNIACYELECNSSVELAACRFVLKDQTLIACSVYRPPNRNWKTLPSTTNICLTFLRIWIAGDNLANVDWESLYAVNNAYPINICETFTEFVLNHGFTLMVQSPTRRENILDIF